MKSILFCAVAAVAVLAGASAASAAQFITWSEPGADGAFSATFGNTGIEDATFDDVFNFELPSGITSFTVNSTFSNNESNDVDFSLVAYNGTDFVVGSTGKNEYRFLNDVVMTEGGSQQLLVSGTSGGNGSYSGVISFSPSVGVVPEPGAWALMILGFGGAGAMLRRRNSRLVPAVA